MHEIELIIALLAVVTLVTEAAERLRLPYPVLLVMAGMALGLVPGLPRLTLDPELVFLVFLPPLLHAAAWEATWPDLKAAQLPIGLLAVGSVLFTTGLVAVAAHWLLPGMGWAVAFTLGAIVSPPDAVAAASVLKRLGLPRRVVATLDGESLANDATGLIAYRFGVAAVLTGQFVWWQAGGQMVWAAGGGAGIGLGVGWVLYRVHQHLRNPLVTTSVTLLTPYLSYLLAEELHVSGVLAVVVAGLFLAKRLGSVFTPPARLRVFAVWQTLVLLLNGLVFMLIGLMLPAILAGITEVSRWQALGYGLLISGVVILGRLGWVYAMAYFPRWLRRAPRASAAAMPMPFVTVVAWAGMRGVVSLAAALALPLTLRPGVPFPHRSLLLFITFVVIFCTLVGQGLSLAPLIRWLSIRPDDSDEHEDLAAREHLATSTLAYLAGPTAQAPAEVLDRMRHRYDIRLERLRNRTDGIRASHLDEQSLSQFQELQQAVITFERGVVEQLRTAEYANEDVLRKIENELDLEEARLALDRGEA